MNTQYKAKNKISGSIQTFSQNSWYSKIMRTGQWILLQKIEPTIQQQVQIQVAAKPKIKKTGGCGCN